MASEYNLKLKAQLDLSDAQAQINRLNTQSNSGVSGGVGGGNNTSINIQSLNTTISNLNQSIVNLNNKITELSSRVREQTRTGRERDITSRGRIISGGVPDSDLDTQARDFMKIIKFGATSRFLSSRLTALSHVMSEGDPEMAQGFNQGIGYAKAGLAGFRVGNAIGGPVGGAILGAGNIAFQAGMYDLESKLKNIQMRAQTIKDIEMMFENIDRLNREAKELNDVKTGLLSITDINNSIKNSEDRLLELRTLFADSRNMSDDEVNQLKADIEWQKVTLDHYKRLKDLSQKRADYIEEQRKITEEEISTLNRNKQFSTQVAGVQRMIYNNRLDQAGNDENLMSIFNTLNEAALKRREEMEDAESQLLQSYTPEQRSEAQKNLATAQNELNQIGGLMSTIQGKIADFDKQFSTIQGLQGVKASEISGLAAIGGGGGGSATSGERGMYIEMQRSNQLLDTIDKTIRGLDDYIKSKDFGGGATFQ